MALYVVEIPDNVMLSEGCKDVPQAVPRMLAAMFNGGDLEEKPESEQVRFYQPTAKLREQLQIKIASGCADPLPSLTEEEMDRI